MRVYTDVQTERHGLIHLAHYADHLYVYQQERRDPEMKVGQHHVITLALVGNGICSLKTKEIRPDNATMLQSAPNG